MSINAKQSIKCPKCNHVGDVTVWNSITVKDSADLKSDLLSGRVNMFVCRECSYRALMPEPMLYHDEDKRLMISFTPCNDNSLKKKLYDDIVKSSREADELKKYEGYNLRFVTDYNSLLEKILIFDNGLNDKAVEVIKLMILSQEPDKSDDRSCRFGKIDGGAIEFMVHDIRENMVYTSRVPLSSYDGVWKSLRQSGVKPYSFGWETVDENYAARLLNGYNN